MWNPNFVPEIGLVKRKGSQKLAKTALNAILGANKKFMGRLHDFSKAKKAILISLEYRLIVSVNDSTCRIRFVLP